MLDGWGWPQWVYLSIFAFGLVVHICNHGDKREYNGPLALVSVAICSWILYEGGFWSP